MKYDGRLEGRELPPRDVRVDAPREVTVGCRDGDIQGRIINLSSEGFRLHSETALQPGCEITLRTANEGPVKAIVCWASGAECGGIFAEAAAL
jgi:hypothetical protein